jgi:hypothetical protein
VARLETQVARFQTTAETAERAEEELKAEKRKLQREVNGAQVQYVQRQNFKKTEIVVFYFNLKCFLLNLRVRPTIPFFAFI